MDRSVLARRIAPAAVFVAVLAGLAAIGLGRRSGPPTLHPVPIGATGGARDQGAAKTDAATVPGFAPYPYGGKVVVPDALLAGLPDEGPVYAVGNAVTADRVGALATALGVTGEPRQDDDGWVAGTGDRVLRVMKTYGASWFFGPDKTAVVSSGGYLPPDGSTSSGGGSTGSAGVASAEPGVATAEPVPPCPSPPPDTKIDCLPPVPVPEPVPVSPPPGPTEAVARAAAAPVFAALGLADPAIAVTDGWGTKDVTATPTVGGLRTAGLDTRVSVGADGGITYAGGLLGTPDLDARYPLLDVRAALDRGATGGVRAMDGTAPCAAETTCPPAPDRVATKVELGLLFSPGFTGDAYLAPAWLLSFADSPSVEPVLALPDRYLATPPPASDVPDQPGSIEPGTAVPPVEVSAKPQPETSGDFATR